MRPTLRRTRRNDPEAGFTLAEMLVVVAILALMAGLVVGHGLPGRDSVTRAALAGWLREARDRAIQSGQGLRIGASEDGQGLRDDAGGAMAFGPGWQVALDAPGGVIGFGPDGTSPGGVVRVSGPGGRQFLARIRPLVGSVEIPQP